jgi:dihydroneopterin aldolase
MRSELRPNTQVWRVRIEQQGRRCDFVARRRPFAEDRTLGQTFVFDITARLRVGEGHRQDELRASVRYDAVVEEAVAIAASGRFQTPEALGETMAVDLLRRFDLMEDIVIGVSKLSPPIPHTIDKVSVEIRMSRVEA